MDELSETVRAGGVAALCSRATRARAFEVVAPLLRGAPATERDARILLTLLLLHSDRSPLMRPGFDGSPESLPAGPTLDEDAAPLLAQIERFVADPSAASFAIASSLLHTWRTRSRASTAQFVLDRIAISRMRAEEPSRALLHQARELGVHEEALRRWQLRVVPEEDAVRLVRQAALRAFWDRVALEVEADPPRYEALFDLSRELRDKLAQLLFAAPRYRERVLEHFDVDLLQQQVGLADFPSTLRAMILYVSGVVEDMVCAADRAEAGRWRASHTAALDADPPITEYLRGDFLRWLRGAFEWTERVAAQVHQLVSGPQSY